MPNTQGPWLRKLPTLLREYGEYGYSVEFFAKGSSYAHSTKSRGSRSKRFGGRMYSR